MVSVLASVLLVVAALSVDLGNAWARGRIVQKQVDVSLLGAGSLLPMSTADGRTDNEPGDIAARAAELLNANRAPGQPAVAAAELVDGMRANGELTFHDDHGGPCSDDCVQARLVAPAARVEFGLARAVTSGVDVSRSATVQVFSELPPKETVVPLWVPSGCGYGPVHVDTTQGGTTAGGEPAATDTSSSVDPTPVGSHELRGPATAVVAAGATATLSGYSIDKLANNTKKASIRLVAPSGSRFIDYATSTDVPRSTMTVGPFEISTEVTGTPGKWRAYAMVQSSGADKSLQYSSTYLVVDVTGTPPPITATTDASVTSSNDVPVGCAGQDRGNFGQLDSPRAEGGGAQDRLARNMAFGLDHVLVPFDTTTSAAAKECARPNGTDPIGGAQLDDVSRDGNNCIKGDTGNDGPALYQGLVAGVDGGTGRLDASRGGTSCSGATRDIGGHTINDDALECFLRGGATLSHIAQETGVDDSMLDPSITRSPRFVWLPMVVATDRAQKGYQPLVDFVPAFLTDQTQTAPATADNGVQVNGSSIKVLRFFTFNKAALPVAERSPSTGYNVVLGRSIARLIR